MKQPQHRESSEVPLPLRALRAHTLPDPGTFSCSQSISKQKFTSSSSPPGLSFQALAPPETQMFQLQEGQQLGRLQITVQLYNNIPRRLLKAGQPLSIAAHYLCSSSYNSFIAFKSNNTKYTLNEIFCLLIYSSGSLIKFLNWQTWIPLSIYPQKTCRALHVHITDLSLHWNWPRGDALNTGRFLTPPHRSWRLTQWFIATHKSPRRSTLLVGSAGLTDATAESWRNLGGPNVLSSRVFVTLHNSTILMTVQPCNRRLTQSQPWFHRLPSVKRHLLFYSITKKYL